MKLSRATSMIALRLITCAFIVMPMASNAQEQSAAFVHGLQSNGETWDVMRPALNQELWMLGIAPSLKSYRTYGEQADNLHTALGSRTNAISISHSNGGVVTRRYLTHHSAPRINRHLSIGSPHYGAPLAANALNGNTHAGLLMDGNAVLIRGDGIMEARSTDDGAVVWQTRISSTDTQAPVSCAPYLCTALGRVWVINASGEVVWAHGGGSSGTTYLSAPATDSEGRIFIGAVRGGTDPEFRALEPPVQIGATP